MTPRNSFNRQMMKDTVLFTLTLRRWGNRRKANLSAVEMDADKRRMNMTKKLIVSPAYDAVIRRQDRAKDWALMRSMPSFIREGIYVVKLDMVPEFERELTEAREEIRTTLLDNLVEEMPEAIREARKALGDQFSEKDYPSDSRLRAAFDLDWSYITFEVPDTLPEEVREREISKVEAQFREAQEEIVAALREGFGALVNHMVDRLTPGEDGKAKIFRDSMVTTWQEFFETFSARNMMNDTSLADLVRKAEAVMQGISPEALRNRDAVRESVRKSFQQIQQVASKLIEEKPSRRFDLDDAA